MSFPSCPDIWPGLFSGGLRLINAVDCQNKSFILSTSIIAEVDILPKSLWDLNHTIIALFYFTSEMDYAQF